MNAATVARIAAWDTVLEEDMPVGTKVTVEDEWVAIHAAGSQPVRVPYTPEDTITSLHRALKAAVRATTRAAR